MLTKISPLVETLPPPATVLSAFNPPVTLTSSNITSAVVATSCPMLIVAVFASV